jgi:hypothetical protein
MRILVPQVTVYGLRPNEGIGLMERFFLLLLLGVLWSGIDAPLRMNLQQPPTAPESSSLRDDKVLEAVFRHQMDRCYKKVPNKIYFLSYQKKDLTDEFMGRFAGYGSLVQKQSDRQEFLKQHPGQKGLFLAITRFKVRNDTLVLVKGNCGLGALDSYSYVYRVEKKNGSWRVRSQRLLGFA